MLYTYIYMYYDLKKIIVCLHIFKISHFTIIDQYTCNVWPLIHPNANYRALQWLALHPFHRIFPIRNALSYCYRPHEHMSVSCTKYRENLILCEGFQHPPTLYIHVLIILREDLTFSTLSLFSKNDNHLIIYLDACLYDKKEFRFL